MSWIGELYERNTDIHSHPAINCNHSQLHRLPEERLHLSCQSCCQQFGSPEHKWMQAWKQGIDHAGQCGVPVLVPVRAGTRQPGNANVSSFSSFSSSICAALCRNSGQATGTHQGACYLPTACSSEAQHQNVWSWHPLFVRLPPEDGIRSPASFSRLVVPTKDAHRATMAGQGIDTTRLNIPASVAPCRAVGCHWCPQRARG
ncbi:hypothetical protein QBC36DRAFT_41293 [Triangularia setosa]|uniref:Uncharacterized protein n=1 Tax=Triangularia setosa TaxID=2587417 RepID=A0AAN6WGV0_9PEZI|nr:hypothetical protein QBC36DRAFT_41293 [Podospora setosa]